MADDAIEQYKTGAHLLGRRSDRSRNTATELVIREAIDQVEKLGAHPLLTDTVVLLDQARQKLADYVDQTLGS